MPLIIEGIKSPIEGVDDASLAPVLEAIVAAAKLISNNVQNGALIERLDSEGVRNVHGELVHTLDTLGTNTFVEFFKDTQVVAGLVCEELETETFFNVEDISESYFCVLDPIDGTSNADIAITIGSIFGIFKGTNGDSTLDATQFLRPAKDFVAAGYVLYGSSTLLILATPMKVQEFTLDIAKMEFVCTRSSLSIPVECPYYSVNQGYEDFWEDNIKDVVHSIKKGRSLRYVGSLVSDFHRDLIRGGVYLYPGDVNNPEGKIRLLYEAAVMSYIAHYAGGSSTNGYTSIFDLQPKSIHQRTPIFVGNSNVIEQIESILRDNT
ncbi:MAG: fructose-bisphosphatase class I [Chloroflexi bacterium]|nr:fructose-bisphosphatase class I [Chloroflexota bacterium]|tara:strand:+ start:1023 stop:1988 length:966 start_codon:yes stop_codon:yes gene_type:complete